MFSPFFSTIGAHEVYKYGLRPHFFFTPIFESSSNTKKTKTKQQKTNKQTNKKEIERERESSDENFEGKF